MAGGLPYNHPNRKILIIVCVCCIFEELLSNFRRWHEFLESELDVDSCQGMSSGRHESMLCRFHHDSIQKFRV